MYSASGAVRSAVAEQQIGDDAVTRRRRLAGRRRAGKGAGDEVSPCTWIRPALDRNVTIGTRSRLFGTVRHPARPILAVKYVTTRTRL